MFSQKLFLLRFSSSWIAYFHPCLAIGVGTIFYCKIRPILLQLFPLWITDGMVDCN
jgi:hypothetical protein